GHGKQLKQVVRHHVAQGAGCFVELSPALDTDGFGCRDLHMIDVPPIPDWLEQSVGKAQRDQVLHGLLAEEMIYSVDLMLSERLENLGIERLGRSEIVPERLLDHHPPPACIGFLCQACCAEPRNRRGK